MTRAVLVDAVRTPSGKGKGSGALADVHPADLLAGVLAALVERNGLDPARVDDVIGGCVSQVGEQTMNVTRTAVLAAGFPETVPATTVDRQCGSSQQAVHFAAQGVAAGAYDIVIACGVESMSRVSLDAPFQGADVFGAGVRARYPEGLVSQGVAGELVAARWKIDREACDAFALLSHQRAAAAAESGWFDAEVVPVRVGDRVHRADETVRPGTTLEGLAGLEAAFYDAALADRFPEVDWVITPGNSSPLTDGASAVLLMSEQAAAELGLRPRATFRGFAVAGDDPLLMATGPIPATRKVLDRAGLSLDDIDVFEVNEAFASVPLAWSQELGVDLARVNPVGGAIALGHPLGSSGTRLLGTLVNQLERSGGRYGLQTMCERGGLANAMIIERVS
ncbi:thiolase family protein [Kribbella sp. NPDC051586]|uniref:thiolase family protein n=1 Tax=Kribbella sp. NPDC051586 TaxID=3364118 RepID=UPI0037ABE033